jgi:hypothetical protein
MTGFSLEACVGSGTGLDAAGIARKVKRLRHLVAECGASQIIMGTDYPYPWTRTAVEHIGPTSLPMYLVIDSGWKLGQCVL